MFESNLKLDVELFQIINDCERLYGQLEALKIPKEVELNLERDTKIKSSYISNSMEGNPLSLPEVTNLLLDDRVPANRDEKEIVNYFNILKNLGNDIGSQLSLQKALQIHNKLMRGINDKIAGEIRNKPIVIGRYEEEDGKVKIDIKHNPPTHKKEEIKKLLEDLFKWVSKSEFPAILKAAIFHHQFVYIHPFEDGNGRTCRLLTALLLMKNNYQINKYFVLDDYYDVDRKGYSDALHTADFGDEYNWVKYFSLGFKYSLQSALSRVKTSLDTIKVSTRPTNSEKAVLSIIQERVEVTSSDISSILDVSRQQAHRLLKGLYDKGFILKEGSTKASYYKLKT